MSIEYKVEVVSDRSAEIFGALKHLEQKEVVVGYPMGKEVERKDVIRNNVVTPAGPPNAVLAWIHNKGSPAQRIPPRPYLEPGVESVQDRVAKQLVKAAESAIDGRVADVDKGLYEAGLAAQNGVKRYAVTAPLEALKARTLASRKRRGFKGTKPLRVTGQLINAVTFAVRDKTETE